jgi:hypothetical protein
VGAPIVIPEWQWSDANGTPYAGGSITTYIQGTSTPKSTWTDPGLTALNTNPVILDAAGRSLMFGDGAYRLVLRDIHGNLIFDIPATTIVSAAMGPVVSAPTIPDALNLLGVNALISAEATARSNADSAEQNARIAADNAITGAYTAADTTLQTNITNEAGSRAAADTNLQSQISALPPGVTNAVTMQTGTGTSAGGTGAVAVTFPAAYTVNTQDFNLNGGTINPKAFFSIYQPVAVTPIGQVTTSGATGYMCMIDVVTGNTIAVASAAFTWFAIGH